MQYAHVDKDDMLQSILFYIGYLTCRQRTPLRPLDSASARAVFFWGSLGRKDVGVTLKFLQIDGQQIFHIQIVSYPTFFFFSHVLTANKNHLYNQEDFISCSPFISFWYVDWRVEVAGFLHWPPIQTFFFCAGFNLCLRHWGWGEPGRTLGIWGFSDPQNLRKLTFFRSKNEKNIQVVSKIQKIS